MENFEWAIIGAKGFVAPRHKDAIERNNGKVAEEYDIEDDWREVLKSEVKNVAICTPNDLHYEMSKACLEAGKTVLCEKPLVIRKEHSDILDNPNLYGVLQLRYHPLLAEMKELTGKTRNVIMTVSVHRDQKYKDSWKYQDERSGGLLFNLGAHYFDILTYLFGESEILGVRYDRDVALGRLKFGSIGVSWDMDIIQPLGENKREFVFFTDEGAKEFNFSAKNNLSEENLHFEVYKAIKEGKGLRASECRKSLELIHKIMEYVQNKK